MIKIKAKERKKAVKTLRKEGILPGILYGPKIKNIPIEVNFKEFNDAYKKSGESTLVSLEMEGSKKYLVLIYEVEVDPLSNEIIHADFYQPILTKKVEAMVPLVFEGESLAVKDLGGTLVKDIQELEVKALPQELPHEIRVDISLLKTFEDEILVKDLKIEKGVEILKEEDEVVANVQPPQKIEEELEKPVEEKVEEVEKIEKEKIEKENEEEK